jgi:M6 family metalloprotease-like protein
VYEYFRQNSYGKFIIDAYVLDWTDSAKSESKCAGTSQGISDEFLECVIPALDKLEQLNLDRDDPFDWFDHDKNGDGYIDNLIILHNGYPAETGAQGAIRSHARVANSNVWSSNFAGTRVGYYAVASAYRGQKGDRIARFNVMMHEYIHTFGAIDLYDVDFGGNGIGGYDIMGYPVGQGNSFIHPGTVGPYTKQFLGWLDPIEITQDGTYPANPSLTSGQVYKISMGYPDGEYLLIENRQPLEWDAKFWDGGGLVIWSIDESKDLNDSTQTRVAILQADGRRDMEKKVNLGDGDDLWKSGGSKSELSDSGNPNTKSRRNDQSTGLRIYDFSASQTEMEFTIGNLAPTPPVPTPAPVPAPITAITPAPQTKTPAPDATPAPQSIAPAGATPQPQTTAPQATAFPAPATQTTVSPATSKPQAPDPDPTGKPTQTTSTASPVVQSACLYVINTDRCPPFMIDQELKEGCDCYNFCGGGQAAGDCCAYGESCGSISCPGGDFIAGCEPNQQPPGPVAPTAPPITELECQVTAMTDRCPRLMTTITPRPEECDCYNFCNNGEITCCKFNEACAVACRGEVVAGCVEQPSTPAPTPAPVPKQVDVPTGGFPTFFWPDGFT